MRNTSDFTREFPESMRGLAAKIVPLDGLALAVESRRKEGRTVVLGNGCFDLLHVGHVRYIAGARALGDILVVALNSDVSVQQLKGEGRPVLPQNLRAIMVAALEPVDFVTIFDEIRVDNVIHKLKPDIHCKGTDYTAESVLERETVERYGGRVAIVGDPKDHSTSAILDSIRGGKG